MGLILPAWAVAGWRDYGWEKLGCETGPEELWGPWERRGSWFQGLAPSPDGLHWSPIIHRSFVSPLKIIHCALYWHVSPARGERWDLHPFPPPVVLVSSLESIHLGWGWGMGWAALFVVSSCCLVQSNPHQVIDVLKQLFFIVVKYILSPKLCPLPFVII